MKLSDEADYVRSFESAGLMTHNLGVVVKMHGREFQLEINGSWR